MQTSSAKFLAFRFLPGQDIYLEIESVIKKYNISAGFIATVVGSLTKLNLRLANTFNCLQKEGHFEIVSLVGTLSPQGVHLHMCVSDSTGATYGGHLKPGNILYTTGEVVIGILNDYDFMREHCEKSGWPELVVKQKKE
eukprot:TRINITY_DN5423_c0_g2_i4.p1 TRINITY_DN5423_c0_g2~~TRINITY_DN5423_c0_g2_i4.p1  ORF type:complete len:139 (-),score=19.77 TRINITY_DN5423_c0_g2_i4:18-434(-)